VSCCAEPRRFDSLQIRFVLCHKYLCVFVRVFEAPVLPDRDPLKLGTSLALREGEHCATACASK